MPKSIEAVPLDPENNNVPDPGFCENVLQFRQWGGVGGAGEPDSADLLS